LQATYLLILRALYYYWLRHPPHKATHPLAMLRAISSHLLGGSPVRPISTAAASSFYEIAGEIGIDGSAVDFSKSVRLESRG
jgi:hypothetical protein